MNIAIVAPSPVPLVIGGAENLWLGLQRFINEETGHHCELFKIPTREGSLLDLVDSYRSCSRLDVDSYDRVITGKYPAWMVQHRSHAIYMLHPLRGLYDTYHFCKQPTVVEYLGDPMCKLQRMMVELKTNQPSSNYDLQYFFDYLEELLKCGTIGAEFARFPGPFARDVVRFLDGLALSPGRIAQYTAISRTVRDRADYFPLNVEVGVAYPPPRLEGYFSRGDDYLFTTSRLDGPKRIGLLIEAMHYVESDIQLLIGGTGPDEERLKQLAAGDPRIVFLGYLNDAQLLQHYADALAVPFVPYDEDYGLITIEAMKSAKPVITTTDAGGVTEFVINGETGLVVPPDPKDLAHAIDYLCTHRGEAARMGKCAKKTVADITWHKVAERLIGQSLPKSLPRVTSTPPDTRIKKRMVVAVTFPIYPPRGGGQSRVYNLYREWARHFDVTIVSLTGQNESPYCGEIAPGLTEVRVPKSAEHQRIEDEYSRAVDWVAVTDIVASKAINATPEYLAQLKSACLKADIVVASHPYFVSLLKEVAPDCPLWFEAHNVEFSLKMDILPKTDAAKVLLDMVKDDESRAWREAEVVYACTEKDLAELTDLYGKTAAKTLVVANGFAADETHYVTPMLRKHVKQLVGLQEKPCVIFMGSWHGPNLEAVERILKWADALPFITFLVVGSAGLYFSSQSVASNVKILGVVSEQEKQVVLSASDLAINPMTSGSGSNLKMLDYFASGVPVLSTPFGARGIDVLPGQHFIAAEIDDFVFQIMNFFVQSNGGQVEQMCLSAANLANSLYSWEKISDAAYQKIIHEA